MKLPFIVCARALRFNRGETMSRDWSNARMEFVRVASSPTTSPEADEDEAKAMERHERTTTAHDIKDDGERTLKEEKWRTMNRRRPWKRVGRREVFIFASIASSTPPPPSSSSSSVSISGGSGI